jgi:putative MATE family efflux protein
VDLDGNCELGIDRNVENESMEGSAGQEPIVLPPMSRARVLRLAAPVVAEYMLQVLVLAVNTVLVSRAGDTALAAVGISNPIIFLFIALFGAVSIGATVMVSQAFGAGDRRRANHLSRQALSWGLSVAVPLSILAYALTPAMIGVFGDDPEVHSAAVSYLHVISATSVVMLMSFLCGGFLRGAGDGRTPLQAAVLANIANLFASWVLIEGHLGIPAYGITGAAWGSVIGRAVGLSFLLAVLLSGRVVISLRGRSGWWPERQTGFQLFRLGIPAAIEQIFNEAGFAVLTILVATLGAAALAANHIAFTALEIWYMPSLALSVTATALAGQSIGARRPGDAMLAATIIRRWTLVWNLLGTAVMVLAARPILDVFSNDPEVIDQGIAVMVVVGATLPFFGLWLLTTGALRGSGDTRSPMIRGAIATWLTVGLAWAGVQFFDLGIGGIWAGYIVALPIAIVGNWRAFKRRTHVVERVGVDEPALGALAVQGS